MIEGLREKLLNKGSEEQELWANNIDKLIKFYCTDFKPDFKHDDAVQKFNNWIIS